MSQTIAAGGPVTGTERIAFLDILRGFAVMAIFIVNIKAMVMPFAFYSNPTLWASDLDQTIATLQKFLVEDKWRTTFSALYGAGLLMIHERMVAKGREKGILLKRNLWLMLFGAIHLLLIWVGDILFIYGVTGLLAMFFVRMGTLKLWVFGLVMLALGIVWMGLMSAAPVFLPEMMAELKPMFWQPDGETLQVEIDAMGGGILAQLQHRAAGAVGFIGFYFLFGGMWLGTLGLMVTGMALFRSGLYRGTWKLGLTFPLAIVFLGAAWYLDWIQVQSLVASDYSFKVFSLNGWMMMVDGCVGAFGYACLVSALVSLGIKFGPVAAVGRMAFSNYIACSLIGTTIAGGHAFGMFGRVSLTDLMIVVAVTFVGMLIWSPLWLRAFRFGPLEWLWRSLVYGKLQPLARDTAHSGPQPT